MNSLSIVFLIIGTFVYGQRSDFKHIDFKRADSVAAQYSGASLKNLPILTHNLTANLTTDVEKFRAIYTWVSANIENDYVAYVTTRKKRKKLASKRTEFLEWNSNFTPKVFEKLIKEKKTACTGYAYLLREMAYLAGFNCEIINGYGRTPTLQLDANATPNHSWNKIEIDGKWYLCDATWSAGRMLLKDNGPQFEGNYFDGYFLAEPSLFVKNHYPLENGSTLLAYPPSFEEFVEGPVVYKEAFDLPVIPISPKKMRLEVMKNEKVIFNVELPADCGSKQFSLVINAGGNDKNIPLKVTRNSNECTLEHTFEKKGLFDVHIQMEDVLIATYVLKVRKAKP